MTTAPPIIVAQPNTPEWLAARRDSIGASEAGAAVGGGRYGDAARLVALKRGLLPDTETNRAMRFGSAVEPFIFQEAREEFGWESPTYPVPMMRHAVHHFISATPDVQLTPDTGAELKSMSRHIARQIDDDGMDVACPDYVLQCQQQMLVCGWQAVELVALIERDKLRRWVIERHERLIGFIVEREARLWEIIQSDAEIPFDWESPLTLDLVREMYPRVLPGACVELSEEATKAACEYVCLGEEIKALEAKRKAQQARFLSEIGEHEAGLIGDSDRMVKRYKMPATTYTVNKKAHVQARIVKYDNRPALPAPVREATT